MVEDIEAVRDAAPEGIGAFRAEPVVLAGDATAAEAFRAISEACLRQFRLNEVLVLQNRQSETVHQARIALRKLRTAFSIFRPIAGGGEARRLGAELRWIASEFGTARDCDVLLKAVKPDTLHGRIAAAREGIYDRLTTVLGSSRAQALMFDLAQWTAKGDWRRRMDPELAQPGSARRLAVTVLDKLQRKVRKHGLDLADASDRTRHELRKDAKKLRYAAGFFATLFTTKREMRRRRKFVTALETLQDRLGALNDLATRARALREIGIADDPVAAPLLTQRQKKALLAKAENAYRDFAEAKRFWR